MRCSVDDVCKGALWVSHPLGSAYDRVQATTGFIQVRVAIAASSVDYVSRALPPDLGHGV
ncbi:hypothetical protein DEBA109399_14765 [Dermacoccus barathri]